MQTFPCCISVRPRKLRFTGTHWFSQDFLSAPRMGQDGPLRLLQPQPEPEPKRKPKPKLKPKPKPKLTPKPKPHPRRSDEANSFLHLTAPSLKGFSEFPEREEHSEQHKGSHPIKKVRNNEGRGHSDGGSSYPWGRAVSPDAWPWAKCVLWITTFNPRPTLSLSFSN